MAGNSKRQGAVRKPGAKKPRTVGSGAERRRGLKGKGPTPKAQDRVGHKARRHAVATAMRTEKAGSVEKAGSPVTKRTPSQKGNRGRKSADLVLGRNPVVEALAAKVPASALHVLRYVDSDPRIKQAMSTALELRIPILEASRGELDRLSDGLPHQGLVLTVDPYKYADLDDLLALGSLENPLLLVALDGVTDPRNLGAIARSVGAFGGHGLIVPSRRSAGVTASAWRASAGVLAHVPVAMVTNLSRALVSARHAGVTVVGLTAESDLSLSDLDLKTEPVVIVIGGEGRGLGRLVSQTCDLTASIPISRRVESLNASVAAGIALHAFARV